MLKLAGWLAFINLKNCFKAHFPHKQQKTKQPRISWKEIK